MHIIIWEFEVKPERVAEFQSIYSSQGDWSQLFRQAPGFLGTELLQSSENPSRFLTVDRWKHSENFANFQKLFREQYAALDARGERTTVSERKLGTFLETGMQ